MVTFLAADNEVSMGSPTELSKGRMSPGVLGDADAKA
jgi:hypothetical protein